MSEGLTKHEFKQRYIEHAPLLNMHAEAQVELQNVSAKLGQPRQCDCSYCAALADVLYFQVLLVGERRRPRSGGS